MRQRSRNRGDRTSNLVGFAVGDVRYAVDVHRVREILNPCPMMALPDAPSSVLGVIDHRELVVPVLDVRRRLGLPPLVATRRTKWIVVEYDGGTTALVVDGVTGVFGACPEQQRVVPRIGGDEEARGVGAVFATTDGLWFVIDVAWVCAPVRLVDASAGRST